MAAKSSRGRKPNQAQAIRRTQQRRYPVLPVLIGGVVVIAIAAILAVVLSGGDDEKPEAATTCTAPSVTSSPSVTVTGKALGEFTSNADDPCVGERAPSLAGTDFSGKRVTIGDDGRAKAIAFVAHWCPHCQREVPAISRYLQRPGLPSNVDFYFVPTDSNPNYPNYPPEAWFQREGVIDVPTLVDDEHDTAYRAFGGGGFPYLVLVRADGTVAARFAGELGEGAYPVLLDALSKGDPIPGAEQGASSEASTP